MNQEAEFVGRLSAREWDYVMQVLSTRPINEAMNIYTKLGAQLNGQAPYVPPPPPKVKKPPKGEANANA